MKSPYKEVKPNQNKGTHLNVLCYLATFIGATGILMTFTLLPQPIDTKFDAIPTLEEAKTILKIDNINSK